MRIVWKKFFRVDKNWIISLTMISNEYYYVWQTVLLKWLKIKCHEMVLINLFEGFRKILAKQA